MFQVTAVEFGHSWYNIYYTEFIICKSSPMNKTEKKKKEIYKVIHCSHILKIHFYKSSKK